MVACSPPTELHFLGRISIKKMACVDKIALFLTNEGTVFSSGFDEKRMHLLGLNGVYEQAKPIPNPTLLDIKVRQISICESHACATDISNRLYTWGTGINGELGHEKIHTQKIPLEVTLPESIEAKDAKVAKGYTVFKTSGGYLYIMGDINLCKSEIPSRMRGQSYIKHIEKLSNYFIRSF